MGDIFSKNRHGKTIPHIKALAKKTGEHAGIPTDTALYVITAFLDVLADEIITNGGTSLPGIVTFYTKDVAKKEKGFSRNGVINRYDKDLAVKVLRPIQTLHRMHTVFCDEGERIVTPDTWKDFLNRYRKTLQDNNFGSGVVSATKVRKADSPFSSTNPDDFVDLAEPLSCNYFETLVKEMNHAGIYEVDYHRDTKHELLNDETRLLKLADLTDETVPYIIKENIEKVTRLKELRDSGVIKGDYLDSGINRVINANKMNISTTPT